MAEIETNVESGSLNKDKIQDVSMYNKMRESYLAYAMSVIASRALPDVRDGLKPVQRRILWSMQELGAFPNTAHRKVARIVGDTMGKYHPHGDSSIEDALVNMAQDWKMGDVLVDGHGNFGSVDGDEHAAARYIEARLSKISMDMLADINKNTVDFVPNFDGTEKEPSVLPARFPNVLVNGTTGIAVGMATNIPPHNLKEVIDGCLLMIDNKVKNGQETTVDELMTVIKGPDFPTKGLILDNGGIAEAYRTGNGKVKMRAKCEIETLKGDKHRIVVTELPYLVNKTTLVKTIADLVKEKKIDGISDLNDYSSREGMQIIIDLKKDANPNVVLNQLYKHTPMQSTYGMNMLCLVPNSGSLEPKILPLNEILRYYLLHQEEVVTRRTQFDRDKCSARVHILDGLMIALASIEDVIQLIRNSNSVTTAVTNLMDTYGLTEVQAKAIVEMRLRALTSLETEKLEEERSDLNEKILYYDKILGDKAVLLNTVREELKQIADKYGSPRKTAISVDVDEIEDEDLIPNEEVVVLRTALGYMKRLPVDTFRSQRRGGKGVRSLTTIQNDYVKDVLTMKTHDRLLFFTNYGRAYCLKGYEIPAVSRTARGTALINLIPLQKGETVATVIPVTNLDMDANVYIATKNGIVKKALLSSYASLRKTGAVVIKLRDDDALVNVHVYHDACNLLLITKNGIVNRFNSDDLRELGRIASGVRCIKLKGDDEVVSMQLEYDANQYLFIISENGNGKLTLVNQYRKTKRGSVGVRGYRVDEKAGAVLAATTVFKDDELLIVTTDGNLVRLRCDDISEGGRIAKGAKLVKMPDGVSVSDISKISFGFIDEE